MGDVLDVGARQGGHGPMIADGHRDRWRRTMRHGRRHPSDDRADIDGSPRDPRATTGATGGRGSSSSTTHPACRAVVAVDADGTAVRRPRVATVNGPVGWIGTIWVAPDQRRAGVGRALTAAVIDAAEAAGCRTLVLVATEAGRPLYEGLGFEVQTWYVDVEAPGLRRRGAASTRAIRAVPARRPRRAMAAPRRAPRPARTAATCSRAFADARRRPASSSDAGGGLAGFVVRAPWGGGATIAPDPDDALAILDARARRTAGPDAPGPGRRPRSRTPTGLARLRPPAGRRPGGRRGSSAASRSTGSPTAIWGQFNHALG